jgi:hypothetical protein
MLPSLDNGLQIMSSTPTQSLLPLKYYSVPQLLIFIKKMGPIILLNNWMMINWKGCGCDPTGGTIPEYAWSDRGKHGKTSYSA